MFGKKKLSEKECMAMTEKSEEVPAECLMYASVKAKLEATNPLAGMSAGSARAVRNAQIQRRMSTRHGQGAQGKKSSWF